MVVNKEKEMAAKRVIFAFALLFSLASIRHIMWLYAKKNVNFKIKSQGDTPVYKASQKLIALSRDKKLPAARALNTSTSKVPHRSTTTYHPVRSACWKTNVTERECKKLSVVENEETLEFLPQVVSGAPGSGNDWILWLASISGYTENIFGMRLRCSIYHGNTEWTQNLSNTSECLFIKSHEPWLLQLRSAEHSVRATLLLRHPYDAAFADYKRELVRRYEGDTVNVKSSTIGLRVDKFISLEYKTIYKGLDGFLKESLKKWLTHANYWLTRYPKPLHILLYNAVKDNTAVEIEDMQRFFGYNFTGVNFRRHCCVMANPVNRALKRAPSRVDEYKEYIYYNNHDIRKIMENAVERVHRLLDKNFPDKQYRINRG